MGGPSSFLPFRLIKFPRETGKLTEFSRNPNVRLTFF